MRRFFFGLVYTYNVGELVQQIESAKSEFRVAQTRCCCLKSVADPKGFIRGGCGGLKLKLSLVIIFFRGESASILIFEAGYHRV